MGLHQVFGIMLFGYRTALPSEPVDLLNSYTDEWEKTTSEICMQTGM